MNTPKKEAYSVTSSLPSVFLFYCMLQFKLKETEGKKSNLNIDIHRLGRSCVHQMTRRWVCIPGW